MTSEYDDQEGISDFSVILGFARLKAVEEKVRDKGKEPEQDLSSL